MMNWKVIGIGLILIILFINMGCTEAPHSAKEKHCYEFCASTMTSNDCNNEMMLYQNKQVCAECMHECLIDLLQTEGNSKNSV